MFIDSHCHLDCIDLEKDHQNNFDNLITEARDANVSHMLCVCIELEALDGIKQIAKSYPDVSYSVGIHPNVQLDEEIDEQTLIQLASEPDCVAVGETGLDYYRTVEGLDNQRERFRRHIRVSQVINKPLIIHSRDAKDDTLAIMHELNANNGVMHCFVEDWAMAKACLDMGFYISFSGIVTFKNALDLQEVAKKVPLERLLIETDSPYLAPMPYRGKQNRPAWVRFVAEKIAELKACAIEDIAHQTSENYYQLFGRPVAC